MPDLEAAREAAWRTFWYMHDWDEDGGEELVVAAIVASERDRLANPSPELVKAVAHRIAAVEIRDYEPVGTPDAAHMEMARAALQAAAKALEA